MTFSESSSSGPPILSTPFLINYGGLWVIVIQDLSQVVMLVVLCIEVYGPIVVMVVVIHNIRSTHRRKYQIFPVPPSST